MAQFSPRVFVIGLAAFVGCVLGALLWPTTSVVVGLVVVVFAIAFTVGMLAMRSRADQPTAQHPPTPPPDGQLPWPAGHVPSAIAPPVGTQLPEPPQQTVSAPPPMHWWAQPRSPTPSRPITRFDPRRARIAQCPVCGAFDLAASRDDVGYEFGCHSCRHTWQWRPGTPWPDVKTDPTRRDRPDRVDPDRQPNLSDDQHLR